jgi:2-amino-4-hydroxy-6-hydroxymethyldihydropteridine diphosphokinase
MTKKENCIMRCYIGIGSNLGDREKNIDGAVQKLRETEGIDVVKVSPLYDTAPLGGPPQPRFLNGVVEIETVISPEKLLSILRNIEDQLGRERKIKNGPRTIDLDILTYGEEKIDEPGLHIPHPRMNEREFVMKPLRDIS